MLTKYLVSLLKASRFNYKWYLGLVRLRLEYAILKWNRCYDVHMSDLESIEELFLKYPRFRLIGSYSCIGYLLMLVFTTLILSVRRQLLFLNGVIDDHSRCSSIQDRLVCGVPRAAYPNPLHLYLPTLRANKLNYSPLYQLCDYNRVCHLNDFITTMLPLSAI